MERKQFGNAKLETLVPTGEEGKQWSASANQKAVDAALEDTEDLSDIKIP